MKNLIVPLLLLVVVFIAIASETDTPPQRTSALWGDDGELWDPENSRLRDFTNVGYMEGSVPIPDWPVGVDVTDFGAIPNDGNDDSQAFIDAIAACPDNHAVFVPVGRYTILQQIIPDRDYFVLRGEDMYATVLFFPKYLNEIYRQEVGYDPGNPRARNTGVQKGFFRIEGGSHRSIENLSFEFRNQRKQGHWEHLGADAINYGGGQDHWIRNIYIKNSDHGISANGSRLSILNIIFDHDAVTRYDDGGDSLGHIPIAIRTSFSLYHNIEINGTYAHDFDLGGGRDNVVSNAKGTNLRLHHHAMGAIRNLYTNLDMGRGTRALEQLSDSRQGNETLWGAFGTQTLLHDTIDPNSQKNNVFVGFDAGLDTTITDTFWYEAIAPDLLYPKNLYLAQMTRLVKPLPEDPPPPPPVDNGADVLRVLASDDNTVGGSTSDTVNNPEGSTIPLGRTYFKFDLSGVEIDSLHRARLRLNARFGKTPFTLTLSEVDDDSWTEETITGANAPAPGTVLQTLLITEDREATWLDIDVTDYVQSEYDGDQTVTFFLQNDKTGTPTGHIKSKSNGNPPHILIEQVPSPVPDPPSPPVLTRTQSLIGNVLLDWEDSPESDVVSYNVYRSINNDTSNMGLPIGMGLVKSEYLNVNSTADWSVGMMRSDWTYYYTVTAIDSHGYESEPSARFIGTTLDVANAPPTFTADPVGPIDVVVGVDVVGSLTDFAVDPEGDELFFFKIDGPDWLTVASDGTISGIPGFEDGGINEFTIQVNARGGRAEAIVQINVLPDDSSNANPPDVDAGPDQSAMVALWTPASMSTTAWYDASDVATLTENGGSVSGWADKSGNGQHLLQNATDSQPATGTRTAGNGRKLLDFDGGDFLVTIEMPLPESGDISIFMVAVIDVVSSAWEGLFSMSTGGDFQFDMGDNNQFNGRITTNDIGAGTLGLSGGPFTGLSIFNAEFHKTASMLTAYVDGISRADSASYTTALSSSQTFRVFSNRSANEFSDGAAGEVLLIEDCSEATRQRIEGYLAHKWGFEERLPETHPWKSGMSIVVLDLDGSVSDADGGTPTATWSQISGPGTVVFGDPSVIATTATFTEVGTYKLRLTANDGFYQSTDELTVIIKESDADSDSIADVWEIKHFGAIGEVDGMQDSDGDGLLDFFEYVFGSLPKDPSDRGTPLEAARAEDGTGMVFRWSIAPGMVEGQHYHARHSTDLSGWYPLPEDATFKEIPSDPAVLELTMPESFGPTVFLRLEGPGNP